MTYFLIKTTITALLIAGISEMSRRYNFLASLLAALPLTSILVFIWIFVEQKDVQKISAMSLEVFFLVIPSLIFFLILPFLLKQGFGFIPALAMDILATFMVYLVYLRVLKVIMPELKL